MDAQGVNGSFRRLGVLKKDWQNHFMRDVPIAPSLIHKDNLPEYLACDMPDSVTVPVVLTPFLGIDPYETARKKWEMSRDRHISIFLGDDSDHVRHRVFAFLNSEYNKLWKTKFKPMMTMEEAVNVPIGSIGLNELDLATSPGNSFLIPFKRRTGRHLGKKNFVNRDNDTLFISPLMRDVWNAHVERALRGDIPILLCYHTLKVERKETGIRIFLNLDFVFSLLVKSVFGGFVESSVSCHVVGMSKVGINPHGVDPDFLYRQLFQWDGCSVLYVDAKRSDASMTVDTMWDVLHNISRFLDLKYRAQYSQVACDTARAIRNYLIEGICFPYHCDEANMYAVDGGLASGLWGTANLNCEFYKYQFYTTLYVYLLRYVEGMANVDLNQFFGDHVRAIFYGDDMVACFSPELRTIVDPERFGELYLSMFNIQLVMGDKKPGALRYVEPSVCDFLKRKFVRHYGVWRMALNKSVLWDMVQWIHTKFGTEQENTIVNVDAALREWFNWGRSEFENALKFLNECLLSVGCRESHLTFDGLLEDFKANIC
jgi:hypothetical protein